MSAQCPGADSSTGSFHHLVRKREQLCWHLQTERLGGLEVDGQPDFGDLLDRQSDGLFTIENATCVKSELPIMLYQARSVTDEAACHDELTIRVHGRNRMTCRERNDLLNPAVEKKII